MPKAQLRFYEELNDLLPKHKRKTEFEVEFQGKRSIKDMIEAQGVPHSEVDLILVNGKSENRIILTKSKKLLKLKDVTQGILMYSGTITEQITRLIDYLDIRDQIRPFSRCLICDVPLETISREEKV